MFGFIKKEIFTGLTISSASLLTVTPLSCIAMNNQKM